MQRSRDGLLQWRHMWRRRLLIGKFAAAATAATAAAADMCSDHMSGRDDEVRSGCC